MAPPTARDSGPGQAEKARSETPVTNLAPGTGPIRYTEPYSGSNTSLASVQGPPRNVSFTQESAESTAYREHNPPSVLRQDALRREKSPNPSWDATHASGSPHTVPSSSNVPDKHMKGLSLLTKSGAVSTPELTSAPFSASSSPAATATSPTGTPGQSLNIASHPGPGNSSSASASSSTSRTSTPTGPGGPGGPIPNIPSGFSDPNHGGSMGAPGPGAPNGSSGSGSQFVPSRTVSPIVPLGNSRSGPGGNAGAGASPALDARDTSKQQTQGKKPEKKPDKKPPEKADELHILLAVTGSVATIKIPLIIHKLKQIYHQRAIIQLVATNASTLFFDPDEIPRDVKVWYDEDEWKSRTQKNRLPNADHALHTQLRRWADVLVVAPCSANTLAKLTYGICDNLLTSVFRVWNPQVPILLAPAMNTHMYTNPVTKRHYGILKAEFPFVEILRPVEKVLVCGDIGMGGMREWTDIVQTLVRRLGIPPAEPEDEDEDAEDSDAD